MQTAARTAVRVIAAFVTRTSLTQQPGATAPGHGGTATLVLYQPTCGSMDPLDSPSANKSPAVVPGLRLPRPRIRTRFLDRRTIDACLLVPHVPEPIVAIAPQTHTPASGGDPPRSPRGPANP